MIYKLRITSKEDESFVREIAIDNEHTYLDMHKCIQENLAYDTSQMASFYTLSPDGSRGKEIALFEMNTEEDDNINVYSMDVSMIREFISKENPKLVYVFDFFSDRSFDIEYIGNGRKSAKVSYPNCNIEKGKAPEQIVFDINEISDEELKEIDTKVSKEDDSYDFLDEFDDTDETPKFESLDDYEDIM